MFMDGNNNALAQTTPEHSDSPSDDAAGERRLSGKMSAEIVAESIAQLGYRVVELHFSRRGQLAVFVEKPEYHPADLNDCAAINRHLNVVLPTYGIEYDSLEISSPGIARLLATPADYRHFVNHDVEVVLHSADDSPDRARKKIYGSIAASDEDGFTLACSDREGDEKGDEEVRLSYAQVSSARLNPKIKF